LKQKKEYKKFFYWLKQAEVKGIEHALAEKKIKVRYAKGVVCTPLDPINKVSIVAPEVWHDICARAGAWYESSEKAGRYLLVSSEALKVLAHCLSGIIVKKKFLPPRKASQEEKAALVEELKRRDLIPEQWPLIDEREKRLYMKWARRLGVEVEEWSQLYLTHTANHANFIFPRLFVKGPHGPIPYSIERSAMLCSCCLELYQVIGAEFREKLVAPCPGAVVFARLTPDSFLLVQAPDRLKEEVV